MALEIDNKKSFGGICGNSIELYPIRSLNPVVHKFNKLEGNLSSDVDPELFHFVLHTGNFKESLTIVNGAEMYVSTIDMIVKGDTHDQIRELQRIRKGKWAIRFQDQNHNYKIMGGYDKSYASLIINTRDNKKTRPERNEIEVTWRCVSRFPVLHDL